MLERPGSLPYRPDIDGLRAIAVLLVVFFHGGFREMSGGFIGVDVFFVISGFLITGIIYREHNAGEFSFADFYVRRIKRICPALFAVLALCAAAGFLLLVPEDLKAIGRSIAASVFFYANWHFYTQVGYFDGPAIEKPLLHTWSLAVEEQFYLIWPALFLLISRISGKKFLPNAILGLAALSLATSQLVLSANPAQVFYLLPYRAWELLLGAYLAVVPAQPASKGTASSLGLAGLAAIAYAAVTFNVKTPFPGVNALFPCVGAALLIFAGLRPDSISGLILSAGPLRFVGKISYSLYLIHWPLFSFAHLVLDRGPTLTERSAIIALSIGAATLSWRFIETPARRAKIRFVPVVGLGASAAAALGLSGILFNVTNGLPFRVPAAVVEADAAKQFGGRVRQRADCRRDPVPALESTVCAIGAAASEGLYDFVVWGDSHSRHLASAFSGQAAERGLAGLVISGGGCAPFLHESRVSPWCAESNRQIESWLKTQTKLKIAFLAGIWTEYASSGLLTVPGRSGTDNADQPGIAETIRFLQSHDIAAAIVEDVPFFPLNVASCAGRARMFGRDDNHCFTLPRLQFERNQAQAAAILAEISGRFAIPLVRTAQAFCAGDVCRAEKDGVILYRDQTHLNTAGAKYLGTRLDIPWPEAGSRTADRADLGSSSPAN